MAKTYKNIYPAICDFDNIHKAYLKARKNKRYNRDVLEFSSSLEENLINIQNHLIWKSYSPGRYKYFTIYEPKERIIAALPFRDRVVHHALCNIIEPIFERSMIYDSYACRIGQGVIAGVNRTTYYLRSARAEWGNIFCLKGDIKKFFPSIDHSVLKGIIHKKIVCSDTLTLIDTIIDSTDTNESLPIGNLTSQLWANVYLNELDHFIKDRLKIKYYVRYMDDFIIVHHSKQFLQNILAEISGYLENVLKLTLNRKTQIFPVGPRSVDFLGYRIWPDYRLLRKANIKRNKRKFKKYQREYSDGIIDLKNIHPGILSWLAHCKHADTWQLRNKVLKNLVFTRANLLS
jgi:retron-type reverse transcriptase